jgi:hypothetical protein
MGVGATARAVSENWLQLARNPIFATFANALGVFAGLVGALYSDDIRSAFPFAWRHLDGIEWAALWFWVCFLIFALTFSSREWAVQKIDTESELRLSDLIRTMPPRGFVVEFANYYDKCSEAIAALSLIAAPKRDQIGPVIRLLLRNIATLAQRFDGKSGDIYAANLMLVWKSPAEFRSADPAHLDPNINFVEPETNVEAMRILVLDSSLSASTEESEPMSPDSRIASINRFALPIPEDGRSRSADGKRWRVLPGAPVAFVEQEPNAYDDTVGLGKWFDQYGDFTESTRQAVEGYFGSEQTRRAIRSFACLPLTSPGAERLGVLNLHSDRPNILSAAGAPSQFYPLIRPLTVALAELVQKFLKTPA